MTSVAAARVPAPTAYIGQETANRRLAEATGQAYHPSLMMRMLAADDR